MRELGGGQWLFREGDRGESAFVVISGRLDIIAEGPVPAVVRTDGRGAVIGEIALLTGQPRSKSVRARRDSRLAEIALEDFMEVLNRAPSATLALARELGTQFARQHAPADPQPGAGDDRARRLRPWRRDPRARARPGRRDAPPADGGGARAR
ncbi:MAG TPA: cyclic nucleotide-binding domain-containing protein [Solirubrobacteraceae bacterium]|nr:cyclic nucleotide-binding domain-containing protein [Solirubrobacteraceae bacterium]